MTMNEPLTDEELERVKDYLHHWQQGWTNYAWQGDTLQLVARHIQSLSQQLEAAQGANKTRTDCDLFCQDCGRAHILDTSIPSEIWNQIAKPSDLLCMTCIDAKLQAKGLNAVAQFYYSGGALRSRLYEDDVLSVLVDKAQEGAKLCRDTVHPGKDYDDDCAYCSYVDRIAAYLPASATERMERETALKERVRALNNYAAHTMYCQTRVSTGRDCDCGLDDARAALAAEPSP